ncbi:hypothetical protein ILUMI_06512 [Ignelater luminosus]|uniref:Carboxylic ester hydrolase n=1 Tax=Ignelater luminosus TaxID=2038154 RepID=A0A8K0GF99_IGNLU|nr:hypothetical protein ILUMI_06512 [Ignelater luminosus]
MFKSILFLYCTLILPVAVYCYYPQVTIKYGTLRGQYLSTIKGRLFSSFTSIPYAKPPVGELRFQVSQPVEPWHGILDASQAHPVCPQVNLSNNTLSGDEDCLYLNVYTPQLSFPFIKLLPVMIFVHGGSFLSLNANRNQFDPSILLDKDIVLVVPNYRLGVLGFLSYGDEILPGNNGLKDQNLAIKWTKENIIYFGGNPNAITLFGQSAGAASVHLHMLSPLSRDLIHGVISESGNALSKWALALRNEGQILTKRLAQSFNCPTHTSYEIMECLKKIDAYDLINARNLFEWNIIPLLRFRPVIEPNVEGAFLTEHPADIIKSGKAANVPFLVGFNSEDGTFQSAPIYGSPRLLNDFSNYFEQTAPIALRYRDTAPDKEFITKKIREFYLNNGEINNYTKPHVTAMFTDGIWIAPTNEVVLLHLKYTNQPVYYYVFAYRGTASSTTADDPTYNYGVGHSDELLYLFLLRNRFPNYIPNEMDIRVSNVLTTLWTNFAKTGNPTPTNDLLLPEKWQPVQSENLEFYLIRNDKDIRMTEKPYWERSKFWMYLLTDIEKLFKNLCIGF